VHDQFEHIMTTVFTFVLRNMSLEKDNKLHFNKSLEMHFEE